MTSIEEETFNNNKNAPDQENLDKSHEEVDEADNGKRSMLSAFPSNILRVTPKLWIPYGFALLSQKPYIDTLRQPLSFLLAPTKDESKALVSNKITKTVDKLKWYIVEHWPTPLV